MNSIELFFHMGGYAFYVWSAYTIVLIALLLTFIWPILRKQRIIKQLKLMQKRQEKLAQRNTEHSA